MGMSLSMSILWATCVCSTTIYAGAHTHTHHGQRTPTIYSTIVCCQWGRWQSENQITTFVVVVRVWQICHMLYGIQRSIRAEQLILLRDVESNYSTSRIHTPPLPLTNDIRHLKIIASWADLMNCVSFIDASMRWCVRNEIGMRETVVVWSRIELLRVESEIKVVGNYRRRRLSNSV